MIGENAVFSNIHMTYMQLFWEGSRGWLGLSSVDVANYFWGHTKTTQPQFASQNNPI